MVLVPFKKPSIYLLWGVIDWGCKLKKNNVLQCGPPPRRGLDPCSGLRRRSRRPVEQTRPETSVSYFFMIVPAKSGLQSFVNSRKKVFFFNCFVAKSARCYNLVLSFCFHLDLEEGLGWKKDELIAALSWSWCVRPSTATWSWWWTRRRNWANCPSRGELHVSPFPSGSVSRHFRNWKKLKVDFRLTLDH